MIYLIVFTVVAAIIIGGLVSFGVFPALNNSGNYSKSVGPPDANGAHEISTRNR